MALSAAGRCCPAKCWRVSHHVCVVSGCGCGFLNFRECESLLWRLCGVCWCVELHPRPVRGVLCGVWVWWVVGVYHRVQTVGESQPIVSECVSLPTWMGASSLPGATRHTPTPPQSQKGMGWAASPYPGTSPSLPALPCPLQLPLPRGHGARLCLPAKVPG